MMLMERALKLMVWLPILLAALLLFPPLGAALAIASAVLALTEALEP